MATVTPPRTKRSLETDRSRIKSPLARLRKYIHAYVSLEGAAIVGLFLALWFWIGLALDYGVFKLTSLPTGVPYYVDWVQILPTGVRLFILLSLVAAILALLALKVITRLFTDFTDAAVALVLERRFPKLLGDRLITAVELSDPVAAEEHGYSGDMVRETIHEAADRVGKVPVKEVFDWKRLIVRGVILGVLTLGFYLLAGAGFCAIRAAYGDTPALAGYGDFNEVATIWVERNVLLRNTIWPRRAHLEIVDYPDNLRIPRESAPPNLRVRAWKYIAADVNAPEGWRLLTWRDLETRPELAGDNLPALPIAWQPRDENTGITVDEVELKLEAFPVRESAPAGVESPETRWWVASEVEESGWRPLMWKDLTKEKLGGLNVPGLPGSWDPKALPAIIATGMGMIRGGPGALGAAPRIIIGPKYISLSVAEVEEQLKKADEKTPGLADIRTVFATLERFSTIRDTLDRLDAKLADRSLRRSVRKLKIPEMVTLVYSGYRATNTNTMTRVADNEFTGSFGELKESVSFSVRGEDYITPSRLITVVDRPQIERLESEEERPAYLYYRPVQDADGTWKVSPVDLRGQRQMFAAVPISTSGDATSLEVPAGTTVTLTALVTKPLREVPKINVEKKDQRHSRVDRPERLDDRTFRIKVPDVRREQRFSVRFTDEDDVTAERKIIILPKEDLSPRVRDFVPDEVIRRGKEGYLIGAACRIPFKGKVSDDHGLARVRFACRVIPGDLISKQNVRSLDALGLVPFMIPPPGVYPRQAVIGSQLLLAAGYLKALNRSLDKAVDDEAGQEQFIDLAAFNRMVEGNRLPDGRNEYLEMGTILSLLPQKQSEPFRKLLREFNIAPDRWTDNDEPGADPRRWVRAQDEKAPLGSDLPLWKLRYQDKPLKNTDPERPQKRFLVEVRLVAEDNYLEGDIDPKTKLPIPHSSASGETFTFVVVPESELLSKIAEEEEIKFREMQKAYKPLPDSLNHMRDMHSALSAGGLQPAELNAYIARCDTLGEMLKTSQQDTKGVYQTYERILREMRTNQLNEAVVAKVYRGIYAPLARVSDTRFDQTYSAVMAMRKALDNPGASAAVRIDAAKPQAAKAREQLTQLEKEMAAILAAMEGLSKLNELIAELARIERDEGSIEVLVGRIRREELMKRLREDK
jgi:hypothetical protein